MFSKKNKLILIADSGSSKTSWALVDNALKIRKSETKGINPFFMTSEEIQQLLEQEFVLPESPIDALYFYGAGAIPQKHAVLHKAFSFFFNNATIEINSDLLGAARSLCQQESGIACILGTGSNSCFYNGTEITENVSPLGYILGDEGSGAVLGRKLLSDVLKNQLPKELCQAFFTQYQLSTSEILENVYRKPFPNRFMAQFTRFVSEHIAVLEISEMVNNAFRDFFERNILQYPNCFDHPINFTGSIAYVFADNLKEIGSLYGLKVGSIMRQPIEGLISFHSKEFLNG